MAWTLHYLARDKRVQDELRREVQSVASDEASLCVVMSRAVAHAELTVSDEVNKLPYLDAVVREATRCYSAGTMQNREVERTTTVRLAGPVRGRNGRMIESLTIDNPCSRYEIAAMSTAPSHTILGNTGMVLLSTEYPHCCVSYIGPLLVTLSKRQKYLIDNIVKNQN